MIWNQKILITGGLGFIGSHIASELLKYNNTVAIIDDLSNSYKKTLMSIKNASNSRDNQLYFYNVNIERESEIEKIFIEHKFDYLIHLAGSKSVTESVNNPSKYYKNNLVNSFNLLKISKKFKLKNFVFSSSCAVYDLPMDCPVKEDSQASISSSPYGRTKLFFEQMLRDFHMAYPKLNVVVLRYFNPAGADPSGMLGENPKQKYPSNLVPYIAKKSLEEIPKVTLHGNDFDTKDGTGVRDYIHINDLALGHIAALSLLKDSDSIFEVINLGSGYGSSVLDVVKNYEEVSGKKIQTFFKGRRPGDFAAAFANINYAKDRLKWEPKYNLRDICKDSWMWINKSER